MTRTRTALASTIDEARFLFGPGRAVLVVLLGLPIFYPAVMSWLYRDNVAVERPALLVDDDRSALSRRIAFDLDATQEIAIVGRPADMAEGRAALERGDAEVLVYIPSDFSESIARGQVGRLPVHVDSSNMLTYAGAMPGVTNVLQFLNEDRGTRPFLERGMGTALAEARVMPIVRDDRVRYRPTFGYGDFLISGVFGAVVQQVVIIGLMVSFGLACEQGRRRGRGRRGSADLAGRALAHLPFHVAGAALLSWVLFPAAGWTNVHPASLFGLFVVLSVATLPLSLTFARLASDRFDAFLLLMFVSAPVFMASGYAWPAERMPAWVQGVAACFPVSPALRALRTIATATGDLGTVVPQLLHLAVLFVGWGLVLWLSVAVGAWRDARRDGESPAIPT